MYSYVRERKDSKSYKRLIRIAYASIAIILISSCAHQRSNLKQNEVLEAICLTGSGKGRIEYFQGKHLFDYQSKYDRNKKLWLIGFNLPVIGQEVLRFRFEENKTTGTFANRLNIEIKEKSKKEELHKFFDQINMLLSAVNKGSFDSSEWSISKLRNNEAGYLLESNSTRIKLFSLSKKDKKFHRMTFNYMKAGRKTFVLNLFSDTCTF